MADQTNKKKAKKKLKEEMSKKKGKHQTKTSTTLFSYLMRLVILNVSKTWKMPWSRDYQLFISLVAIFTELQ